MDESDKTITFEVKGICCFCNNFNSEIVPSWHTGERCCKLFTENAEKIKSDGEGRDSTVLMDSVAA